VEGSEIAKRDHQRNKSEIVKLVKEMFGLEKWGDEEYKKKLQELVMKEDDLIRDVIRKIKLEKIEKEEPKSQNDSDETIEELERRIREDRG